MTVFEAVLRRDRAVVVAILVGVIALAWIYILLGAGTGMTAMGMVLRSDTAEVPNTMMPAAWTLGYAGLMFVMWWVMMAAMMLPSAAPARVAWPVCPVQSYLQHPISPGSIAF
jgi:predicted metal-binding membrane protein